MKIKAISVRACAVLALSGFPAAVSAQSGSAHLPFDSVSLGDLSAFRSPGANWRAVGDVSVDPRWAKHIQTAPGTGVLVNLAPAEKGTHLFSEWEHGDVELELDFMMPKGSNSGVYLHGRYEIQLLDSWGVKDPSFADAGGIYQRWDPQRGPGNEGFQGRAPRINASRAPGLWQHLRVVFQAPRFDAQGNKISNARFVQVEQNGVVIHDNVEVTGPTRAAAFRDEAATGPLMIQGDHGPVALRDIRFKRYSGERVQLSNLRYRAYQADTGAQAYAMEGDPVAEGMTEGISSAVAGADDKFAVAYEGTMKVPVSGRYRFDLLFDWVDSNPQFAGTVVGGGRLTIGGRQVLEHEGRLASSFGDVELAAGEHPFTLTFYKGRPWTDKLGVGLYVEGPQIQRHALHVTTGAPVVLPGAITVQPQGRPMVLRSFVRHGETKRTHGVSVGYPSGVHYSLDLANGALLKAWRGPFLETTPMWHDRGDDQIAEPLGSVLTLSGAPSLAFLADQSDVWPDSADMGEGYALGGYQLDGAGRPTFNYRLRDVEVQDRLLPATDSASLRRELRLRAPEGTSGLFLRLAAGEEIRRLSKDVFAIGDMSYYVSPGRGMPRPFIREQGGAQELLVPVRFRGGEAKLDYTITW